MTPRAASTIRTLLALVGLYLCGYGLHCTWHMREFIGAPHWGYWTNVWFYKSHAALGGMIACSLAMGIIKDKVKK